MKCRHSLLIFLSISLGLSLGNYYTFAQKKQEQLIDSINSVALNLWNKDPQQAEKLAGENLKRASAIGCKRGMAESYRIIGISYWSRAIYDEALLALFQSLKLFELIDDNTGLGNVYMNIGLVYDEENDLEKASSYHRKAITIFKQTENLSRLATTYNNLGAVFHKLSEKDSAIWYFQQALILRKQINEPFGIAESYNNLGVLYRNKEMYDEALQYTFESLEIRKDIGDKLGMSMTYYNIGQIYRKTNNKNSARLYFDSALRVAESISARKWIYPVYRNLKEMAVEEGNYRAAFDYFEKEVGIRSEIFDEEKAAQVASLEMSFENEKKEREIAELKNLHEREHYIFNFILLGFCTLIIVAALLIYIQRDKIRRRNQLIAANKALAEAQIENSKLREEELKRELKFKNKELASYTINFIQKTELMEELKDKITALSANSDGELKSGLKQLNKILDNNFQIDRDWEDFRLHFEQVNPDFFPRLKQRFPDLTSGELKLCALLKLNLNMKESARILGVSPESVKTARYRLRKKLAIETEDSLSDFIIRVDQQIVA